MRVYGFDIPALAALAHFHKTLADETRLRMLYLLLRHGELCVCDMQAILQTTQSTASRHLTHLKQAGLVQDRHEGTWVHYRLVDEPSPPLGAALDALAATLDTDSAVQADLARARARGRATCAGEPVAEPR